MDITGVPAVGPSKRTGKCLLSLMSDSKSGGASGFQEGFPQTIFKLEREEKDPQAAVDLPCWEGPCKITL